MTSTHTPQAPTRALPQAQLASPGPLGELFWLLSHPNSATLSTLAFGLTLLAGLGFESVWTQALGLTCLFTGVAQLTAQPKPLWLSYGLWSAGGLSLLLGVGLNIQGEGSVELAEGGRAESYLRGGEVKVEHHLGAPLALKRGPIKSSNGEQSEGLLFSLGGAQAVALTEAQLRSGERFEVGPWSLSLTAERQDHQRPRALIELSQRGAEGDTSAKLERWMSPGDRFSPSGELSVSAFEVTGQYQSQSLKELGGAVDLELAWRERSGAQVGQLIKERAWHFVDLPTLSERAGRGAWFARVKEVSPSPVYVFRVSERAGSAWLLLGLALWAAAMMVNLVRFSARSTPR